MYTFRCIRVRVRAGLGLRDLGFLYSRRRALQKQETKRQKALCEMQLHKRQKAPDKTTDKLQLDKNPPPGREENWCDEMSCALDYVKLVLSPPRQTHGCSSGGMKKEEICSLATPSLSQCPGR